MANIMTKEEIELMKIVKSLPKKERGFFLCFGQGLLLASKNANGKN